MYLSFIWCYVNCDVNNYHLHVTNPQEFFQFRTKTWHI